MPTGLFRAFHRRRLAMMCLAVAEGRISAQFGLTLLADRLPHRFVGRQRARRPVIVDAYRPEQQTNFPEKPHNFFGVRAA